MSNSPQQKISTFALVLLITSAIDSIRNLPATALFGSSLVFFFICSAVVFLIPVALISAELSACWSDSEGGIYQWLCLAFNKKIAFIGIWLQWINTMVWYPTILSFIAATAIYFINPSLVQNKIYLISVILLIFWSLTLLNLKGLKTSATFVSICTILGMIIPMISIILLAFFWLTSGHPTQITLTTSTLLPKWHDSQSWVSLTAIMASFLGMELAAVHIKQINEPQKNFPKAMFFSTILILSTMILGSLAIAMVLPASKISLVGGVMQAFSNFLSAYHIQALLPIVTVMLLIGSIGGMVNWIISPAKGLLQAAKDGFLPPFFSKKNQHNVASHILLTQAVIVTFLCIGFLLIPSVNGIYWLLTDLSTELYMLLYVLLFVAAIKLKLKYPNRPRPFSAAGGKTGYFILCFLGLMGCTITLIIGFIPPENSISIGSAKQFQCLFTLGIVIMLLPAILIYFLKNRHKK